MGKGLVMRISLPIVVVDNSGVDISIYPSIEDAELHLEPIDVKNGEYRAYDAAGRVLALGVVKKRIRRSWGLVNMGVEQVLVRQAEEKPTHCEELRAALIAFLDSVGIGVESSHPEGIDQLIQTVAQHCGS